eukprot:PITA_16779
MYKFDGSHLATWIAQMEQYFTLNYILDDATQLSVGIMYLDNERWQWWQWHQHCYGSPLTWQTFKKALTDRFDQDSNFLGRLTKLQQTSTVNEYITAFEALAFRTGGLHDEFYMECFPNPITQISKPRVAPHKLKALPKHKVQKVSLAERRKQGLCYYCDEKYSPEHKCKEPKFFQIDATDHNSLEEAPPLKEPEEEEEDNQQNNVPEEPVISLHALARISSPQTLKIRGFIKHCPVVVLIDSGCTHNFIHQRVAEVVHCFVRAVSNFQVQIANGRTIKCEGRCENVKLQMGDYQLKTHMFTIHMGGCDIVLGAEWLCTLGPITMDFQELYMSFKQNNHTHTLCRLQAGAPSIISSHRMEKLLKKGDHGVMAQFNAIQAFEPNSLHIHPEKQQILNNHLLVFDKPHELPPSRGEHDHSITLVPGAQPPNVHPYRYLFAQKNEIEKIIKELLEAGVIRPSNSPYSSSVVMVLRKMGNVVCVQTSGPSIS